MHSVNVHEAKSQLSRLLAEVEQGNEVVLARAGVPVARLTGLGPAVKPSRPLGRLRGRFACPDDFDTFLADEIAAEFEGYV